MKLIIPVIFLKKNSLYLNADLYLPLSKITLIWFQWFLMFTRKRAKQIKKNVDDQIKICEHIQGVLEQKEIVKIFSLPLRELQNNLFYFDILTRNRNILYHWLTLYIISLLKLNKYQ